MENTNVQPKQWWLGPVIVSDLKKISNTEQQILIRQLFIIFTFSFLAIVTLLLFSLYHIFILRDGIIGTIELIFSVITLLHALYLRVSGRIKLCKQTSVILLLIILLFVLVTGGIDNTGLYWFATFPVATLFLIGARQGLQWIILAYLLIILLWCFKFIGLIELPYSFVEMRQYLASLIILAGMTYIFAKRIEHDELALITINRDLAKTNEELITVMKSISNEIKASNEHRNKHLV